MKAKRGKCLALVAVLAMVVCAFAVISMPATDAADATTYYVGGEKASEEGTGVENAPFATIAGAVAAANDAKVETLVIEILGDTTGDGVKIGDSKVKDLTINFNTYKFTMDGSAVGSTGTETQSFQLLKDTKVTMNNGTIASSNAKILIQNYCDLTLNGMILGMDYAAGYVLSNNNGSAMIKDTTINATSGQKAFDVCGFSTYSGVAVTVDGASVINGNIELSSNTNEHELALNIKSGTINGAITKADGGDKVNVTISGGTFANAISDADATISIAENAVLKANVTLSEKGNTLNIAEGGTYDGTVTFNDMVVTTSAMVKLKADAGGVKITAGSLDFSGAVVEQNGNTITIISGTAKVTDSFEVPAGTTIEVKSGASLTVEADATLSVSGTITGAVTNNGKIEQKTGADVSGATITGDGTIENKTDDSDMSSVSVGGESDVGVTTFPAKQVVTVNGSWTLISGADITIKGKLVVPAGATLTISAGAKLTLDNNAVAEIDGTVIILENDDDVAAGEFNVKSGNVVVSGDMQIKGTFDVVSGALTIEAKANTSVEETGSLNVTASTGKVVVKESATFGIYGSLNAANIENNGTIVFDSMVPSENSTINMKKGSALDVINFTAENGKMLTVKDVDNNEVKITVGTTGVPTATGGKIVATVSGLSITEKFVAKTSETGSVDKYSMIVSGDLKVSYSYIAVDAEDEPTDMGATATVEITAPTNAAEITDSLAVGEKVTVENKGKLSVAASVDATKGTFKNTSGKVELTGDGMISVKSAITSETGINATKYTVGTGSDAVIYYVTIDAAIAAANAGTATDFTIIGTQVVTTTATFPAGSKLDVKTGTLEIGTSESTDVTLTIASGASLKGEAASTITVYGTLYAEDKTNIVSAARAVIKSDVYAEQLDEKEKPLRNGWAKWTNVYTALSEATENQIIKVSDALTITKDLTIPAGVTLDLNGKNMTVNTKVTLTVDGTLFVNDSTVTMSTDSEDSKNNAKLVLNGIVKSDKTIETAIPGYNIAGAYYDISSVHFVTTVENAASVITTVDDMTVTLKGELTVKDVTFAGTSDKQAVVNVEGKITFGTITIDNAKIVFGTAVSDSTTVAVKVSGTVTNSVGTVEVSGNATTLTFESKDVDDIKTLIVTGALADVSTTDKSKFIVSGTVSVGNVDTIASAVVDGTLNITGTAKITTIVINGTVAVAKEKSLTSTTMTVMGAITAEEGAAKAGKIYIGISADDALVPTTGAVASVVGNVTINAAGYALVAPGSEVSEKLTKATGIKSTEFYVNDVLYLTGYALGETPGIDIRQIDAHIENAYFKGWYKSLTDSAAVTGALGTVSKVYANIEYNVYKIDVIVGNGIENVAIDGVLYSPVNGVTNIVVSAGLHTVTYTLKTYYEGTPTLYVNGTAQSGLTFTTEGTPTSEGGITYTLQLSGVSASTPSVPTSDDKDDGMGLTDILLIVLVVLIAIMAIMVALRMMRS